MMMKTVRGQSMSSNWRGGFFAALLLALAWTASAPRAVAQSYTWTTAASGNWSHAANWTPNTSFPNSTTAAATIPTATPAYTITIDNTSDTINSLTVTGEDDVTISGGTLIMDGTNPTIDPGTSDTVDINSTLQLNQTTEISGGDDILNLGSVTGTGGLTINTPDGLIVNLGSISYAGATTLETGTTVFLSGGTAASSGFDLASDSSEMEISGNQTINNLSGSAAGAYLEINGYTFTVVNSTNTTYTGSIHDGGDGGSLVFSSSNGSTLVLSGDNNYSGTTTVSSGTLQFGQEDSLYNGTTSSWTANHISVANTATLALNVGGTGEFTSSDISTLLTNLGTGSGGFASGSAIGFDTTDAGGNFTYANAITNTHAGADTLGLVKLGTGTLTLTGANTYTGTTTIDDGTLAISGSSAAINSSGATVYVGKNNGDNATLSISNGGTVKDSLSYVGYGSGSTGSVTVTDTTWNNSGDLVVGHDGTGTVTVSAGGTVMDDTAYIGDDSDSTGDNNVTVTGTNSTWTNSRSLIVGHDGTGTVTVSAGGAVSDANGYIGDDSDSTGNNNVTVTGTDSTWTNSANVYVGDAGAGTLMVSAGATVKDAIVYIGDASDSTGSATVTGTDSTWTNSGDLYVGDAGTGTLTVSAGGTVKDSVGYIGYGSGNTGANKVTVTGTGSDWTNSSNLVVGYQGAGTLLVSAGGTVFAVTDYIGNNTGGTGTVTVTGTGSTLTNSSNVIVGYDGTGTLTVSAGGAVSDITGYIGNNSDSAGNNNATVTGTGSAWTNTGDVYVGYSGTGTLTVADGGTVKSTSGTGTLQLAFEAGSSGTLDIGSGDLSGTIDAATINGGSGTAVVNFNHTDDLTLAASLTGSLSVNQKGSGSTALSGANTYTGGTTISAGTLVAASTSALGSGVVNQSGGTLETDNVNHVITMSNGFNQTAGTLVLHFNGAPNAASNDVVNVTGSATLDGNLNIAYAAGKIAPLQSETYTAITTTTGITDINAAGYEPPALQAGALQIRITGEVVGDDFDVTLTGKQLPFTGLTGTNFTANQKSVASYLDRFDTSTTLSGPVIPVLQGLDGVSVKPSALGPYLDQLTPLRFANFASSMAFNNASFSTAALDNYLANDRGPDGNFVSSAGGIDTSSLSVNDPNYDPALQEIHSRLLAWSPASSTGLLSDTPAMDLSGVDMKETRNTAETNETSEAPAQPWNVFISGHVVLAQDFSDSTVGTSHADATTGAVSAGADYKITPHLRVGAEFAYGHTSATLDDIGSSASVDTYSPGLYASFANQGWYANALGSYGFANYNQNRHVAIGTFTGTASSHPGGDQIIGDLDGGYDFHRGPLTFGPTLGVQYVHLDVDDYSETSLPGADLTVNQDEADSLRSSLGGRISYAVRNGALLFNPHLNASWQHEFMDPSRGVTSQFNGIGAGSFVVHTAHPSRDSALVDVGLDTQINDALTAFVDYSVQAGQSNYFGQSIQTGLKAGF